MRRRTQSTSASPAGSATSAGAALGTLVDLPLEQRLAVGTAVSGFYVRSAQSPSLPELIDFLRDLPASDG
jgi:hypothetical protein